MSDVAGRTTPVATGTTHNFQDVEEERDDIHVECQGCEDVLFRRDGKLVPPTDHKLRVEDEVRRFQSLLAYPTICRIMRNRLMMST